MSTTTLIILGAGGHAAVVADAAMSAGWIVQGILDDAGLPLQLDDIVIPCLGSISDASTVVHAHRPDALHAAIGDPAIRRRWLTAVSDSECPPIVHPRSIVASSAVLGAGVFVGPGAIVNARARIGRGVIVNSGAIVEHDGVVGDFAHIGPGSVLAGDAKVGDDALVGVGARVCPGIRVGRASVLGAGAVAVADVPDGVTAVGVPARPVIHAP